MTKMSNVRWSESLRLEATRLLASCGLIQILQKYGEVRLLGSYAANLMMQGDIDFHVIRSNGYTMPEVLKAYNEIALSGCFEQQTIWNWNKNTRRPEWKPNDGLSGYYVYLRTR